jgi:hypothetical protein
MKKIVVSMAIAAIFPPVMAFADTPALSLSKQWTYSHAGTGVAAEIPAYDAVTNTIWVAGVVGVDVLDATTGTLLQHINTSTYGAINSVAIHNGIAAFAIESTTDRTSAGTVKLFDTTTRSLSAGVNSITVGALPDMLTFTKDGSRLLVANEATPTNYAGYDPAGSVSIIDMNSRTLIANAGFAGVPTTGTDIRTKSIVGMDYEPEYIAVNAAGTKAFVTLQEANAIGVLDLATNAFTSVIGLGTKNFNLPGNYIDPSDKDNKIELRAVNVRGLYQPDGIAAYDTNGKTYLVMANEGDTREDEGDKARAGSSAGDLSRLNISTVDSTLSDKVVFGARSFSIRDALGNIVYDSGNQLEVEAIARGIYDDSRSDDKGVEPEGVELMHINGYTLAFIGLERTTKSAVAIYDVTNPEHVSFVDMIVSDGDLAPEGLKGFEVGGVYYLVVSNETSGTTSLYSLAVAVPEPSTYGMLFVGLGLIGFLARRRKSTFK